MGPAYFEALASMRALYAQQQQQQFHPHMMMAGPPPPPGAGNHPWWLLAQARQQQQRLLAAAAAQRFPAGKFCFHLFVEIHYYIKGLCAVFSRQLLF